MKVKKYRKWKRIDRWLQTAIIAISVIICTSLVSGQNITSLILGILKIDNNVTVTSGQLRIPNGTAANPSLLWTDIGFYRLGSSDLGFSTGGGQKVFLGDIGGDGYVQAIGAAPKILLSSDISLTRDAPTVLAMKNGNQDNTQRWYGANGAYFQVKTSSELLTIQNAASTDTAMDIPLNATVQGVAVYVVTVIPTAATFTVTGATSGTAFNTAAVGTGAGSNDTGNQNCPYKNGAAQKIRITPNLAPAAATGQVRVVLMYTMPSPPTS